VAIEHRKDILQDYEMTQSEQQETTEITAAAATNRRLLTVPKTAAYLGLSEYAVRKIVRQGQLPTRQVASRQMIPVTLLREWLGLDFGDDVRAVGGPQEATVV
jgi:Helix-turn-helix domain